MLARRQRPGLSEQIVDELLRVWNPQPTGLVAQAGGLGRVVFEREFDVLTELAGSLTGVYEPDELARLRDEWE